MSVSGGPFSGERELEGGGGLEVVAEPGFDGGLALSDIFGAAVLEHHGDIMARHHHAARPPAPDRPGRRDRPAAPRRVVARIGPPAGEPGPVLGGAAVDDAA